MDTDTEAVAIESPQDLDTETPSKEIQDTVVDEESAVDAYSTEFAKETEQRADASDADPVPSVNNEIANEANEPETNSPPIDDTDSIPIDPEPTKTEPEPEDDNPIQETSATVVVVEDISNANSTEKSKDIDVDPVPVSKSKEIKADPKPDPEPEPEPTESPTKIVIPKLPEPVDEPQMESDIASNPRTPTKIEVPKVTVTDSKSKEDEDSNSNPINSAPLPLSPDVGNVELNNPDGFGKDFNWEMHKENQELRRENSIITEQLKSKQKEINTLEEALTTLHEELKFLESQEVQSVAKDLAKKNRKLSVQLQRERNRAAQTHIESQRLKSELESYSHHNFSPKKVVEPLSFSHRPLTDRSELDPKTEENEDEKGLNQSVEMDFQKMRAKLVATKNQLAVTKDLNNKMRMALQRELGVDNLDSKAIHEMIRDGGSWKGRSEKIALLQTKLDATKKELELMNDIGRGDRSARREQAPPVIRNKNDEHKHQISQIAMERMKQYESAQRDIERLEHNVDELRSLIKAKNSRIKGLENTASSSRQKLQFFVKKSKSDDSLIETLQSQLNQQLKLKNALLKKEKLLNRNNTQITSQSATIKTQNAKIEMLNQTVDEMKSKILEQTQERTQRLETLFTKWNDDDKNYQIGLLKTENETQKDIISSYKKNLAVLQKRLSRKASPREQPQITTGRSSKNAKVQQLKERMDAMNQEQQLVKASYLSIIEGKEQEIAICRKMLKDQANIHQNANKDLQEQIQEIRELVLRKS